MGDNQYISQYNTRNVLQLEEDHQQYSHKAGSNCTAAGDKEVGGRNEAIRQPCSGNDTWVGVRQSPRSPDIPRVTRLGYRAAKALIRSVLEGQVTLEDTWGGRDFESATSMVPGSAVEERDFCGVLIIDKTSHGVREGHTIIDGMWP
jgi:hypothetical protein